MGYANLAASYLRLSLVDSAQIYLDQAIAKDPGNAQVLYLMSEAFGAESSWLQALSSYHSGRQVHLTRSRRILAGQERLNHCSIRRTPMLHCFTVRNHLASPSSGLFYMRVCPGWCD